MNVRVPAVVVGAGINGLGVARSLARAHVPVWIVDSDTHQPGMHTRAARPWLIAAMQGEALVEGLWSSIPSKLSKLRPVLILTQEESVKAVSLYREVLAPLYRFTLPEKGVVDTLLHKQGFQRVAEALHATIPPLVHIRSIQDLPQLKTLRFPVVVKPGERHAGYSQTFKKAYRIGDQAEAEQLIHRILPVMPDVVVQEWIEGADSDIFFCLQYIRRNGVVAAAFTGRKIRSWPPQVGGTASCTAAPEFAGELEEMTTRFFNSAGVVGLAGMEFKHDARSDAFLMVEPTIGRTDYQEEVATLNGINLPYAAYCAELDMPVMQLGSKKRPFVWRDNVADSLSAATQKQRIRQGFPEGGVVVEALWRWHDYMPALMHMLERVRFALHVRVCKVLMSYKNAKGEP